MARYEFDWTLLPKLTWCWMGICSLVTMDATKLYRLPFFFQLKAIESTWIRSQPITCCGDWISVDFRNYPCPRHWNVAEGRQGDINQEHSLSQRQTEQGQERTMSRIDGSSPDAPDINLYGVAKSGRLLCLTILRLHQNRALLPPLKGSRYLVIFVSYATISWAK